MILSFSTWSYGQINEAFLKHLVDNKLDEEHITYLNSVDISTDSVHFFLAKYDLHKSAWESFFSNYQKGKSVAKKDSQFMKIASAKLLGIHDSIRSLWFDYEVNKDSLLDDYSQYYRFAIGETKSLENVPFGLEKSLMKYEKIKRKSPFLAATMSAVIPGLGKIYMGNYRTGFYSLFTHAVFAVQGIESYNKKGATHALTLTNVGFFSGYYVSNIVGSYRVTKQKKKEFKNQFLIDASLYFSSRTGCKLY